MRKILIVDDDAFMADIYSEKLEGCGYATETAGTGMDAMQMLKDGPPDLVLLDLMLPDMDGVQVLKFIRALEATRQTPVIVLTNAFMGDAARITLAEGANRCLTKAVCTPNNLAREVEKVLAPPAPRASAVLVPATPPTVATIAELGIAEANRDPDQFQTEFRRNVTGKLTERLAELRQLLHSLVKADRDAQIGIAMKLYRAAHSLTGMAGLSGLMQIARMSSALELLLMDIQRAPVRLTQSSLRTMAQAVDLIALLYERSSLTPEKPMLSPLIMVVDDEPLSRESICSALENVHLQAVNLSDAGVALRVLAETRFDLVFLDVEMPGQNGFDVCERIREMPANRATRVVFVTIHDGFENWARSNRSGGNDFISKSASSYEIAVKTLSYLLAPPPIPAPEPRDAKARGAHRKGKAR
jgi:CheY-like chemotaxis protein